MKSLRDATCAGFRDSAVFATLPLQAPQMRVVGSIWWGSDNSFREEVAAVVELKIDFKT
jgi:hypothetical protein